MRHTALALAVLAWLPAGGCVAGIAASAAGMAVRSAQPAAQSNAHLMPAARAACSSRAAPHGTVHIIDVEQRSVNRLIVWGTATGATQRQSFECHFNTAVTAFKLRPIRSPG